MNRKSSRYQKMNHQHRNRNRWTVFTVLLSCAIVITTVSKLVLPALTMTDAALEISTERIDNVIGNPTSINLHFNPGNQEQTTYYYLSVEQDNAGIDLNFDNQNQVSILNDQQTELTVNRVYEEDGTVGYWFSMTGNTEETTLSLACINGIGKLEKTVSYEEIEVPIENITDDESTTEEEDSLIDDEAGMLDAQTEESILAEEAIKSVAEEPEVQTQIITQPVETIQIVEGKPYEQGQMVVRYGYGQSMELARENATDENLPITLSWLSQEEYAAKYPPEQESATESEVENLFEENADTESLSEDIETDDEQGYIEETIENTEETENPQDSIETRTEYTAESSDGISVTVSVPSNAFNGEDVVLIVRKLNPDALEYMEAKEHLDSDESIAYDGFVAIDIHFEDENGNEIEPVSEEDEIEVQLNATAIIPQSADENSIRIQHHIETVNTHTGNEMTEISVENVADISEGETIEVYEDDSLSSDSRNINAVFSVDSFSTFTVTWNNGNITATLTIHYVDEYGNEIAPANVDVKYNPERNEHDRVLCSNYAVNLTGDGYFYQGAFTSAAGGTEVQYVTYVFSGDDHGFRANKAGNNNDWFFLGVGGAEGQYGATEADLYLRYRYVASEDTTARQVETVYTDLGGESGQVVESGGTNTSVESDGVSVSKTLEATDIENVFDITLQVQTKTKVEEAERVQPLDVVIVMDISNTMKDAFSGDVAKDQKRYQVALDSASQFIRQFQIASANMIGDRRIGLVFFNTGLADYVELSSCKTDTEANSLIYQMTSIVNSWMENPLYTLNHTNIGHRRFTNMETGIVKAEQMLANSNSQDKYIIFMTDGFPTTYGLPGVEYADCGFTDSSDGYQKHITNNGVDPYGKSMYNHYLTLYCTYGTSYSDTAAHWAEEHAKEAKASGIKIFSIGVDVAGQTISSYESKDITHSEYSIIEAVGAGSSWIPSGNKYVIDDGQFISWLTNQIGSGEGYYFDSTSTEDLIKAFQTIFDTIKTQTEYAVAASWVAEDPITSSSEEDYIEFIKFFDQNNKLVASPLSGSSVENGENTASWNSNSDSISWDLKNSGYTSEVVEGVTYYTYRLKYRIRLENEKAGFVDSQPYYTNGNTTLTYREIINGSLREFKMISFPIPQVKGYLENLMFYKIRAGDELALSGAKFKLTHDSSCNICHGDNTAVSNVGTWEGISDQNGQIIFENIPSGHDYVLTEVEAPAGFSLLNGNYSVSVRYNGEHLDAVILIKNPEGNQIDIDKDNPLKIENETKYELPRTGGTGEWPFIIGGAALIIFSLWMLYRHRKGELT